MKKKKGKLIVVVIYNQNLLDSLTLISLYKNGRSLSGDDKILIWDNSLLVKKDLELRTTKLKFTCQTQYFHTPENLSLAIIYNNVINENPNYEMIFLFDQDSTLSDTYFDEITEAAQKHIHIDLFLPLIGDQRQIYSPGHFHFFKGSNWKHRLYGVVKARNNVAVISGMAIRMRLFKSLGLFEEKLTLYGIDTNFMIRFWRIRDEFYVLSSEFKHDLSDNNTEDLNTKLHRFRNLRNAAYVNANLFSAPIVALTYIYYFYKTLIFSFKFKSFKFYFRGKH